MYSDHRKKMLPSTLEIIMFLKLNKRLWDLSTVLDAMLEGDLPPHNPDSDIDDVGGEDDIWIPNGGGVVGPLDSNSE